ncbi:MAG: T9SS type A sorting domain-containing protein, partial [Gramella sp.]|nr:T9SS type A sorting domain-containing protein [Christiangramia sp.]
ISPTVSITSPEDNASFTAPVVISINAEAGDVDGTVISVEFFEGANSVGIDTDASDGWGITWTDVESGTYELTAVATDNDGDTTISALIFITILTQETINVPEDLAAEWISNNEIYVTWIDNNTDESEFILERSTNMDFSGQVTIFNLPANTTTYNDRNLFNLSGSKVYYRIKAVKGNLISAYSNIALAEVYGGAISIPRDENDKEITDESLMVYPNPSNGESTIRFNLMEDSEYSLDLYDAKGAYLFRITSGRVRAAVEYVYNLEIQHLPNGMYLVILNSSTGSQNFNLILRR